MTTYIYGKLTPNKFYTPIRTYSHSISFPSTLYINTYLPCIFTDKLEVFYNLPVFNSYFLSSEENITVLYSVDKKMTIIKTTNIQKNKIYTFKVIEETADLRVVDFMSYDNMQWVGREITGKLEFKKNKIYINTIFGRHPCILQNNKQDKKITAKLWKIEDEKMYFVEVNNPVKGPIKMAVDGNRSNCVMVSNKHVRGVLINGSCKEKEIMCVVREELLGFYIFEEYKELKIGDNIEAEIVKSSDQEYHVKYMNYSGIIKKENVSEVINQKIKGKIIRLNGDKFELVQDNMISVPFEFNENIQDEDSVEENIPNTNDIQDILNTIKNLTESRRYMEVKDLYYKHITELNSKERDILSLVYCNFLEYTKDNILKELKKISKYCSDSFYEKLGMNSESEEVIEYCYNQVKKRCVFKRLLDILYKKKSSKIEKYKNDYLDLTVDCMYKYEENPRKEVESIIGNNKQAWLRYLENEEDEEYKRYLYRRVITLKWKVSDMKEWFRMWMSFEKGCDGNVEEVRARAKEFVEKIKK